MTKLKMSPPRPHPKQCQVSRFGVTTNEGVFSPWNGHRPLKTVPAFLSATVSPTTSTTLNLLFTSAATPTAKLTLQAIRSNLRQVDRVPNMLVGLSSLDKP